MPTFLHQPPIDKKSAGGFVQEIRMMETRQMIGITRWHAPAGEQGVAQILDLSIVESHRRKSLGGQLLRETCSQIASYFRAINVRPRRVWISVEQKSQVIARAFLTQHGFHHVATIENLLIRQDALIYQKSFD